MIKSEKNLALLFIGLGVYIFIGSFNIRGSGGLASASFFPKLFSVALIGLSTLLLGLAIIRERKEASKEGSKGMTENIKGFICNSWVSQKYVILTTFIVVLYILVFRILGYLISTFLLLSVTINLLGANKRFGGIRAVFLSMGFSLLITTGTYLLFTKILYVFLPRGILYF